MINFGLEDTGPAFLTRSAGEEPRTSQPRLLGIESVGIDSNPVAHAVAESKFIYCTPEEVAESCQRALGWRGRVAKPKGEFWELCYHADTLREISRVRRYFLQVEQLDDAEKMLRALVVGILHGPLTKEKPTYLSAQMPRTYATKPASAISFWKKNGHEPKYVSVWDAVKRRAEYLLNGLPQAVDGQARLGDSRAAETFSGLDDFDMVITSPPYLGMRTYWPDQWLRNWFMGGPDFVEYSRADQIQSQDIDQFTTDLARVWENTANVCRPGSKLIVRFGSLPSYSADPSLVLKNSLRRAEAGWRLNTIKSAGLASAGKRQADQFQRKGSTPIAEIDAFCTLNT